MKINKRNLGWFSWNNLLPYWVSERPKDGTESSQQGYSVCETKWGAFRLEKSQELVNLTKSWQGCSVVGDTVIKLLSLLHVLRRGFWGAICRYKPFCFLTSLSEKCSSYFHHMHAFWKRRMGIRRTRQGREKRNGIKIREGQNRYKNNKMETKDE